MNKTTKREEALVAVAVHAESVMVRLKLAVESTPGLASSPATVSADLVRLGDSLDRLSDLDDEMNTEARRKAGLQDIMIYSTFLAIMLGLFMLFAFFYK